MKAPAGARSEAGGALRLPMVGDAAPDAALDRRAFLGSGVKAAVLAVLAGSCTSITGLDGSSLDADVLVTLSDYPTLSQVGGVAGVRGGSLPLALVHIGQSDFRAFSRVCPHAGTTVDWTGEDFLCPNHGAAFASDGHWVGGQPTRNLWEFAATYDEVAGTVLISAGP